MNEEKKWKELLKYGWAFAWIPFVDFAFVSGSMAMGEAREDSDFDIILGCKKGRMFTARALTICIFNLLGKRRKGKYTKEESKNKFCFNHFVTPDSYTLRPPYNLYWQTLYQNLLPAYGEEEKIKEFFSANAWCGRRGSVSPRRPNLKKRFHFFRTSVEFLLGSFLGTPIEYVLMRYQLARIRGHVNNSMELSGRMYVDENELELHPNISRIEGWIEKRIHKQHSNNLNSN